MQRAWAIAAALLFLPLAGCGGTTEDTTSSSSTSTKPPPPVYPVTVRVVQETVDGPPLSEAEVYFVAAGSPEASDPGKLPGSIKVDAQGDARMVLREPGTLLAQAFGPGDGRGWTREGMRIEVGANITVDLPLRVENRTIILPLLRTPRELQLNGTWTTAHATPAVGNVTPAWIGFALPLSSDPALAEAYLSRLSSATVVLRWCNTSSNFADMVAGFGWDATAPALVGTDVSQTPALGCWEEKVQGAVPAGDRSKGLHIFAGTNRAVVGDVTLEFRATLHFGGQVPAGLAKPPCYPMAAC